MGASVGGTGLCGRGRPTPGSGRVRPASPPPGRDTPEMQNGGEGLRRAAPGPESAQGISAIFIGWENKD